MRIEIWTIEVQDEGPGLFIARQPHHSKPKSAPLCFWNTTNVQSQPPHKGNSN
jgi:hypothetical protein